MTWLTTLDPLSVVIGAAAMLTVGIVVAIRYEIQERLANREPAETYAPRMELDG